MNVLLVDDEAGILTVFGTFLEEVGYSVRCATDGQEAWELFQAAKGWDAVVLDRAMPHMGGEELAGLIKRAAPAIPLIMITGAVDAILEPTLFDAILAKPFRPAELLDCLIRCGKGPPLHTASLVAN